ncbi:hypothetical protein OOK58_04635 [Streptomyces sp. NBC_01728]|uniref:hypothetical protein n=1 Tax=unclassified Streptomyces TaxID=2593676 RepID=UPI00224E392A|nr:MULTISPECIES: hypothetical protein [unclassified Streptomyces]MCX4461892.1 hypothetical protein [Streptomyces sp. NBC_01719]MCX4490800.1 hypothetical protein [Streptomyces sp. NBC_01728]MCX4594631.1 hypothetical protein [Streptomyces sp. NBC_01549]
MHSASLAEDTDYAVPDVAGDGGDKQTLAEVFDWAGHVDQVLITAGGISGTGPPDRAVGRRHPHDCRLPPPGGRRRRPRAGYLALFLRPTTTSPARSSPSADLT